MQKDLLPPNAYAQALVCDFGFDPIDDGLNDADEFGDTNYEENAPDIISRWQDRWEPNPRRSMKHSPDLMEKLGTPH
jgi:hypothetical protein